ncbi:hypothetical protein C8R43DRAFT_709875 [Mycena crocata]|nr:hypothetical protein C8R43DRAFT_709875 [Mycena crocata]
MATQRINLLTPPAGTRGFRKETRNLFSGVEANGAKGVTWNVEIYGYRIANTDEVHIIILHSGRIDELSWSSDAPFFKVNFSSIIPTYTLHLPREGDLSNPVEIYFHEKINLWAENSDRFQHDLGFEDQWSYSPRTKLVVRPTSDHAYRFGPLAEPGSKVHSQPLFGFTHFKLAKSTSTQYIFRFTIEGTSHKHTAYFNLPSKF